MKRLFLFSTLALTLCLLLVLSFFRVYASAVLELQGNVVSVKQEGQRFRTEVVLAQNNDPNSARYDQLKKRINCPAPAPKAGEKVKVWVLLFTHGEVHYRCRDKGKTDLTLQYLSFGLL